MSIFTTPADSAVEEAYEWLREEVATLPWNEEAHLSESELAKNSKFSRTPIREALLRLQNDGLVKRIPNRGAVVPALQQDSIDTLMEVREVIEIWAIRKAITTNFNTAVLWELIEKQKSLQSRPVDFIDVDTLFHTTLVRHGRNDVFDSLYRAHRYKQLRLGVKAADTQGRIEAVIEEHCRIVEAIDSRDPNAASEATQLHLASTKYALEARN